MKKPYFLLKGTLACLLFALFGFLPKSSLGQIFAGEGLNMVGEVETPNWVNPPAANSPLGSEFQVSNGGMKRLTTGVTRWQATWQASATATQQFLFTSGPSGNPYANKWANVTPVVFNSYQTYVFGGGTNNTINVTNGRYYTLNWRDAGYTNTQAVFMETNNAPVTISGTSQSPLVGNVTPADNVVITVTTSAALSPQEKVYIRYTTNSYASSSLVEATMSGNSGTATIPAQPDGTTIQYYPFTSTATIAQISTNYEMFTIRSGNGVSYTSTAAPLVNVTFQVDMGNEVVSGNGVHIAGSFNSFSPNATPLTLVSGTTYAVTVALAQNSTVQYKFLNGNSWGTDESVPGACNVSGNREFSVGTSNATVPLHCFASCTPCVPKVPVKFSVNMSGLTISGNGVHIAGNFGSAYPTWNPSGIQLTHEGGGIYSTTLMLIPGTYVPYKYLNGNSWGTDEGVPGACNVFGNREIQVPGSAFNVPVHCFGTCNNCVSVTFRVNMSNQTVSGNGVHVAGSFQGWNPGATPLSPVGGGLYETTVKMDLNTSFQYKFINGNSWGNDEGVPGICQVGGNRANSVASGNKVLSTVCFGQCIDCSATSEWLGTSNNFSDGNNWSAGVAPNNCNSSILIKAAANQPNLGGGTFSCKNVTFQPNTGISLASGATLNVCGNLLGTPLGGGVSGAGSLVLNGTSAQTISGNLTLGNLRIANATGVSLAAGSKLGITGALKLQSGNFNVSAGNLVLLAGPAFEGRLLKIEGGSSLIGNATVQKYLAGLGSTTAGAWYFLGAPTGGVTLGDFDQRGNTFHPATFLPANETPGSLYTYSQNAASSFDDFGWAKSASAATPLAAGTGVRVWAKKNIGAGLFEFAGAINTGGFSFPLSFCNAGCSYPAGGATNGWNLLANPYPCPIDWNVGPGWSKTGIDQNALYIWNAASGNYSVYDGVVGTNGGNKNIASGQAFFVRATSGAANLSVNEDAKIDQYTSGMRTSVAMPAGMKIKVSAAGKSDEVWLDISAERWNVAVQKLPGSGIQLALGSGNGFAIAGMGTVAEEQIVPLTLKNTQGIFQFQFEPNGSEWDGYQLYLKDNVLGTVSPIFPSEGISSIAATGFDQDRFQLIVQPMGTTAVQANQKGRLQAWPNPATHGIFLSDDLKGQSYEIFGLEGKKMASGTIGLNQAFISLENLKPGSYLVRLIESGQTFRISKK